MHSFSIIYWGPTVRQTQVLRLNKAESLESPFIWRETANISMSQIPQPATWTSGAVLTPVPACGTNNMNCLCVEAALENVRITRMSKRHHYRPHSQPTYKCACLCSGWVEGIWPDSLGSLVSCPRATFLCLIKLSIVFKPVGLSRSYMRGVVYAPRVGDLQKSVCVMVLFPPPLPFQNYCWL